MMDEIAVKQCIISFFQIMDNQANELVCMICGLWKHNRLKKNRYFRPSSWYSSTYGEHPTRHNPKNNALPYSMFFFSRNVLPIILAEKGIIRN